MTDEPDSHARARPPEAEEAFTCESCSSPIPVNDAIGMDDCWFCPACYAKFKAKFDTCTHEWDPYTDSYGDPGQCCRRCSGFVTDDIFSKLFPSKP